MVVTKLRLKIIAIIKRGLTTTHSLLARLGIALGSQMGISCLISLAERCLR